MGACVKLRGKHDFCCASMHTHTEANVEKDKLRERKKQIAKVSKSAKSRNSRDERTFASQISAQKWSQKPINNREETGK